MNGGAPVTMHHKESETCCEVISHNITTVKNNSGIQPSNPCDDSDQFSIDVDDFSDGFEQRVVQTDCESFTTEISSISVDTDITSSPPSVVKHGYPVGLESDFSSANSSLSKVSHIFTRTSPDGASCPDNFEDPQVVQYRTGSHQNSNCKPLKTVEIPSNIPGNVSSHENYSRPIFASYKLGSEYVTVEIGCAINENKGTHYSKYDSKPDNYFKTQDIQQSHTLNNVQYTGGFVNEAFEAGDEKYLSRPRSVSLPNLFLNPWKMKHGTQSRANPLYIPQDIEKKRLNVNVEATNPTITYARKDGGFDSFLSGNRCDLASSNSNASSNRRHLRNCRRHLCSNSNSSSSSGNSFVDKGFYSEGGTQSTKNRKHLPNPFNKTNHRFHSTLHCPCFLFFCFLCCYPAVYLMQRSDIQFISGEDDLARVNGKRATLFYVVGGVAAVVFLSTFLFCMYFFLGDSLLKAKGS